MSEIITQGEDAALAKGSSQPIAPLNRAEQAAIILSLLEPEQARSLAGHFDEGRIERAIGAFERMPMIGKDQLIETIESFIAALEGDAPLVAGGPRRAQRFASAIRGEPGRGLPDTRRDRAVHGSIDEGAEPEEVWTYLRNLEPDDLARLVRDERPSVIAAVLREVGRDSGTAVLKALDAETGSTVVRLLIQAKLPSPPTLEAIAESLRRDTPHRLVPNPEGPSDATSKIAEIMNAIPASRQQSILEPLREEIPEPTARLEGKLLRFGILHERLPKTIVPMLFREIDNRLIDVALKHSLSATPETSEFLLGSISQRLAEQIRDRIEESAPVTDHEGEEAQTEIMQTLFRWADEGRFSFKPPAQD